MFSEYDTLSFDCYGTLIDWESGIAEVLRPWARAHGKDLGDEDLLVAYAEQEARAAREHPRELYPRILARAFRATGDVLGLDVPDAEAKDLATSVPRWPAFDDSAAALAQLGQRFDLVIVSNVDNRSFAGSSARLGTDFTHVITAEDVGAYKPAPNHFEALNKFAAAEDRRVLHVAQSLFHDHVPAREAGFPCVWINRRHDKPGWGATPDPRATITPRWTFDSMADFAEATTAD